MSDKKMFCKDCQRYQPLEKLRCAVKAVKRKIEKGLRIGPETPACFWFLPRRRFIENVPRQKVDDAKAITDRGQD